MTDALRIANRSPKTKTRPDLMADQTFRAIIEVVNRASAPLRKIERDIAGLAAPIVAVKRGHGHSGARDRHAAPGEQAVMATEKVGHLGRELGAIMGPWR
jgi:hypothetical protein